MSNKVTNNKNKEVTLMVEKRLSKIKNLDIQK